jgi:hypothetical protein
MMRRLLRGSSSRGSKEKENEEKEKPKYNLPRTTEVQPSEWPCDAFLEAARIYEDFYYLAENAGSPTSSTTSVISTSYSLILSCKIFTFMLADHHPR